jgi:hypothetical protein
LKPSFDLTARPEDCAYKVSTVDATPTIADLPRAIAAIVLVAQQRN